MLRCPNCQREFPDGERFCAQCAIPLAPGAPSARERPAAGELRRRAQKVRPAYAEGKLELAVRARNEPEAEMLRALLLEAGIPSLMRRSPGLGVPEMMPGGMWDVLVAEGGLQAAREALLQDPDDAAGRGG